MNLETIIHRLNDLKNPEVVKTKKRFAIESKNMLGIFLKDLKTLAKEIEKDDSLALELFDCGIYEAKLLVPMIFNPKNLTPVLMEKWISEFDNWEICDTFCMGFFNTSPFVLEKALRWIEYPGEYQKRAGFVCYAAYSFTNKEASNDTIRTFFPKLIEHSNDERKYVMKAINWAIRQIGKRNLDLNKEAIEVAKQILAQNTKSARWIANDALRELTSEKVVIRHYPRSIYGKNNNFK